MKYILILILLCTCISFSQSNENIKNAKNFSFEGLKLGTSYPAFKVKFQSAEEKPELTDKEGVKVYFVFSLSHDASAGGFYFYKNKLYKMSIIYSKMDIHDMGGAETIINKFVKDLGRPTYFKDYDNGEYTGIIVWAFKTVGRSFILEEFREGVIKCLVFDSNICGSIDDHAF